MERLYREMQEQQKLNVLFMIHSLQGGGAERMVVRLANYYAQMGHEISIGLFDLNDFAYEVDSRIRIIDFSTKISNRIWRIVGRIHKIKKTIKKQSLDVIYAFTNSNVLYAIFGKIKGVIVIGAERANPKVFSTKYRMIINLFAPLCDGYVFQTQGAKSLYPVKVQRKSVVIGNIAPNIQIKKNVKEKNSVCAVGRLNADKDFFTLLRSFQKVVTIIPGAHLYIYGRGDLEDELIKLTKELNIDDNVIWKGFSKNIGEELQKYEIFAFSSKAEGMPNALIEAMSVGMACVSTDCEFGPSELIQHGKNGLLVPVGDQDQMAGALIQLMSNESLRENLGKEAKDTMKDYSEEIIGKAYLDYTYSILKRDK